MSKAAVTKAFDAISDSITGAKDAVLASMSDEAAEPTLQEKLDALQASASDLKSTAEASLTKEEMPEDETDEEKAEGEEETDEEEKSDDPVDKQLPGVPPPGGGDASAAPADEEETDEEEEKADDPEAEAEAKGDDQPALPWPTDMATEEFRTGQNETHNEALHFGSDPWDVQAPQS